MRALTRSLSVSLLLASPAAAQTYEPVLVEPVVSGAPTTMTPLNLGDDNTAQVDLGFEFTYWGQTFTSAWVSSNGFVSFGTSANLCCNGTPIEQAPRNTIYAFWTDLVSGGNPYYTRADGSVLFGWYGTTEYGTQNSYTFEIGLSNDNSIRFNYGAMPSLTYHLATAGITGPEAGDNILLFYGKDTQFIRNQSGVLSWGTPQVTVDCNVTPMDPSCPPESVAPIDFVTSTPITTVIDAANADAAADAAEAIVASLPEPEQEITVGELEPSASIPERVAEAVAVERLNPDQVAALAAPGASPFAQGSDFVAAFEAAVPSVGGQQAAFSTAPTGTPSAAFTGAFETVPSPSSSAASAANTLEVLNTLSAPAPQMAAEQQPAANAMAEGQGEVMAAIASVPGFSAYSQVALQDRPDFYAIRDIYRNRRLRDANFEMYRLTRTNTDKLQEMADAQYRR